MPTKSRSPGLATESTFASSSLRGLRDLQPSVVEDAAVVLDLEHEAVTPEGLRDVVAVRPCGELRDQRGSSRGTRRCHSGSRAAERPGLHCVRTQDLEHRDRQERERDAADPREVRGVHALHRLGDHPEAEERDCEQDAGLEPAAVLADGPDRDDEQEDHREQQREEPDRQLGRDAATRGGASGAA